jgi:adenine-specific DNA-methyltransferase
VFDAIASSKLNGKWNFNESPKETIIDKINNGTVTLESISRKIFKGSSTGNDDIYLVQLVNKYKRHSVVYSRVLDSQIKIENDILKPFIYGQDVRRFYIDHTVSYLIFPYIISEQASLISYNVLKSKFPLAYCYFEQVRKILMKRKIKLSPRDFYKYSAGRSLSEYGQCKILIPDMLVENRIGIDIQGEYYHGPAIHSLLINEEYNFLHYYYVLALLSSKLFWFFISNTSTALRGNAFRLTPEYLNPFPVKVIDKSNKTELQAHDKLVSLVEKMLAAKKRESLETDPEKQSLIARQTIGIDQAIDAIVYHLYGLTAAEVAVIERGR